MSLFETSSLKKYFVEILGTFVLVLFGCGTAVITGNVVAIALAFGLSIVVVAYTFGRFSGTHLNPAVTFAVCLKRKMNWGEGLLYIGSQVIGAILGALVLWGIVRAADPSGSGLTSILGSNVTGALRVDATGDIILNSGWRYLSTGLIEFVLSFVFITVVLFATEKENKFAALLIGGGLTFVHLLGAAAPGGTSVNPARSIGPALISLINGQYIPVMEVGLFIILPILGALLAVIMHNILSKTVATKQNKNETAV